jgi:hypothetical protein
MKPTLLPSATIYFTLPNTNRSLSPHTSSSNPIIDTQPLDGQTVIEFSNGSFFIVNSRLTPFRAKVQLAEQYRKTNYERGKRPISFILDPKKKPLKKRE